MKKAISFQPSAISKPSRTNARRAVDHRAPANPTTLAVAVAAAAVMSAAPVANAQDVGDVAVVPGGERTGSYDSELAPGYLNDAPRQGLAKAFFENSAHVDQFDFLVVLTNFPYLLTEQGKPAAGYYFPIKNRDKGIGTKPLR